jgi:hypothetical protein
MPLTRTSTTSSCVTNPRLIRLVHQFATGEAACGPNLLVSRKFQTHTLFKLIWSVSGSRANLGRGWETSAHEIYSRALMRSKAELTAHGELPDGNGPAPLCLDFPPPRICETSR